jgi:5-methyltetrahydrofolate--homocysteine methyltransferase
VKPFLDRLAEKVIVFDGAMGTNLQTQQLDADDFGGEKYNGCNEYLVLTRPTAVEVVHNDFLEAGCDVIETDSFGTTSIVLAEYGLADQAYALNVAAARLAKKIANDFSSTDRPRYVAGSMGPTTKLLSLGHISFREMENAFYVQAKGLVDGGADLLVVETCQDILQAKAALSGIFQYFGEVKSSVPVIASVTIETMGTMLLGTEIASALTTLEPFELAAIGLNCATGPKEMSECVRYLCQNSPRPVFAMPNAGIPENIGGRAAYRLDPEELVYYLSHFVKDIGVGIVGGCCGTTKEHIQKLVGAVGSLEPVQRKWSFTPSCSSLYQSVPMHVEPAPVIIGERTNANGSKQFRDLLATEDWEGMVGMAKGQVREGSHLLDVCVAYVGRAESDDMREVIQRFNTQVTSPLMIDSTEMNVLEEALQRIGGRAIVNSVNLEDGEERVAKILRLCKKYGAAVVALTIDEQGMAKTVDRKMEIARRIKHLAIDRYGMRERDLVFDTLTFTLASGDEEFRKAGISTLESMRALKTEFPDVYTSLGVSNISFGLSPQARHVLNSVFLHFAIEYGLDMAIVHASKILPLYKISKPEQEICRRLIFDERTPGSDPLQELLAFYSEKKEVENKPQREILPLEERLKKRVIEGDRVGLQTDLDEALKNYSALDIINTILLDGMKVVGELFGSGQMQLPFVLQSAEVMKNAVAYLEKFMDKTASRSKGTLVIATVKGDVHDIGKNLVDIILTNNGYKVVNLGIQCPLDKMLSAFREHQADAIGMSGLLVKSTLVMKENLGVMNERSLFPPVILGGAALTRRYVEQDLRAVYPGDLYYANDAFDGLRYMDDIVQKKSSGKIGGVRSVDAKAPVAINQQPKLAASSSKPGRSFELGSAEIPKPPFFGTKIVTSIPLDTVFPYINEVALIRGQWQVRKGGMSEDEYKLFLEDKIYPERRRLEQEIILGQLLDPAVVYGYFPCQSEGDDLIIYLPTDEKMLMDEWDSSLRDAIWNQSVKTTDLREGQRFTFPRQKHDRHLSISDYFLPVSSGKFDVVGFHLVTMGEVASNHSRKLFAENQYQEYLYFHGMSVESAEALAELWHKNIRKELDIHHEDAPDIKKLFSQKYHGSRYSFGYPACPNLEDQQKLFQLLHPGRIGVSLTDEFQLVPEQSTSAIIVHHPKAKYFTIA